MQLVATRGIPASGKSTWAKQWVSQKPGFRVRVNRDDARMMMFGCTSGLSYYQENLVTKVTHEMISRALKSGMDAVMDDMNLRLKRLHDLNALACRAGADFWIREFPVDIDVAVARDATRENPVGEDVIRRIARKFPSFPAYTPIVPDLSDIYVPDESKPKAIIVDLDGTVALKGDRDIYDYSKVLLDTPNIPVVNMVRNLTGVDEIVFMSGREDYCLDDTRDWIKEYVCPTVRFSLLMRRTGDTRADRIVKRELFDTFVRNERNVLFTVDDRDQVVDMWRSIGLTCFQVAEGDF